MVVTSGVNAATGGVVAATTVLDVVVVVFGVSTAVCASLHVCSCWLFEWPLSVFEWPPFVLWHNHSNFFKYLSKTVLFLYSLTLLINSQPSLKLKPLILPLSSSMHVSLPHVQMSSMLFIDLTHSSANFFPPSVLYSFPGGFDITLQLKATGSDHLAYTSKDESPMVAEIGYLFSPDVPTFSIW